MKCLFAFAVSAIALCAMADEEYISPITGKPIPKDSKYTIEQIKERDGRVLKKTGGFVDVESKGVAVAVLDGRQKPGGSAIQFSDVFGSLSKTNVKVERNPLVTGTNAVDAAIAFRDAQKAAYAIVIVDSAELRGLTVIPEDRVAIINAAYYRDGGSDPLKPEVRIHKEIWRALGFVAGIGYAPYTNDVMQPVFSTQELDSLVYQVMQPMNFQKMYGALSKFGVTRNRRVPYRLACIEGWAHSPTNEYEKAVWEEVKAEKDQKPSNPLKINFDPKTAPKLGE